MSKLGCRCGHVIVDQTDALPYKAYIREDKDVQEPIELMARALAQFFEVRGQEEESRFIHEFISRHEDPVWADFEVKSLKGKPLAEVLFSLIFPIWNRYDRMIFECEACGRLWVGLEGNNWVSYLPETATRSVLWLHRNDSPHSERDE